MQFPLQLERIEQLPTDWYWCTSTSPFGLLRSLWSTQKQQHYLHNLEIITDPLETWDKNRYQINIPDPRLQTLWDNATAIDWRPFSIQVIASDLQWEVWEALITIPFAATCTYQNIAQQINRPKAVRAVGTAIGQNPIFYLIPCHRVLRSNGTLGGYLWGIELKQQLLDWEKSFL